MKSDTVRGYQYTKSIPANTDTVLLPAGTGREFVMISLDAITSALIVSFGQTASGPQGIFVPIQLPYIRFNRSEIGGLIDSEIHVLTTATVNVSALVGTKKL